MRNVLGFGKQMTDPKGIGYAKRVQKVKNLAIIIV